MVSYSCLTASPQWLHSAGHQWHRRSPGVPLGDSAATRGITLTLLATPHGDRCLSNCLERKFDGCGSTPLAALFLKETATCPREFETTNGTGRKYSATTELRR